MSDPAVNGTEADKRQEKNLKEEPQHETRLKIADALTAFSVMLALCGFLYTWSTDHEIRKKQEADKVRMAASKMLVKIDRWRDVSLSLYEDAQPSFSDVKMLLKKNGVDVIEGRDRLWQDVTRLHNKVHHTLVEEQVAVAYLDLYAYRPEVRRVFLETLRDLEDAELVYPCFCKLLRASL